MELSLPAPFRPSKGEHKYEIVYFNLKQLKADTYTMYSRVLYNRQKLI